jgi:hypothetical protein
MQILLIKCDPRLFLLINFDDYFHVNLIIFAPPIQTFLIQHLNQDRQSGFFLNLICFNLLLFNVDHFL